MGTLLPGQPSCRKNREGIRPTKVWTMDMCGRLSYVILKPHPLAALQRGVTGKLCTDVGSSRNISRAERGRDQAQCACDGFCLYYFPERFPFLSSGYAQRDGETTVRTTTYSAGAAGCGVPPMLLPRYGCRRTTRGSAHWLESSGWSRRVATWHLS